MTLFSMREATTANKSRKHNLCQEDHRTLGNSLGWLTSSKCIAGELAKSIVWVLDEVPTCGHPQRNMWTDCDGSAKTLGDKKTLMHFRNSQISQYFVQPQ